MGWWELGSSTWGSSGWSSWGWGHQVCAPTSRAAVAEQRSTDVHPASPVDLSFSDLLIYPYLSLILTLHFAPLALLGSVWVSCHPGDQGTGSRLPGGCEALWRGSGPCPSPAGVPWPWRRSRTKAFWRTSARPPKPVRSRSLEAPKHTETPWEKQQMISVDQKRHWRTIEIKW